MAPMRALLVVVIIVALGMNSSWPQLPQYQQHQQQPSSSSSSRSGSITSGQNTSSPSSCDYWLAACFADELLSAHFAVFYNTTGPLAVTPSWAENVSIVAEKAYAKYVVDFGFPPPARNPVPIYLDLEKGGFTNFLHCELCGEVNPAELQKLQIEYTYKSPCVPSCGLPLSYWVVAHEVFHTIQYSEFGGRLPFGSWLTEGSANWAAYQVTRNESRWDPWVISAWLGQNGSTEKAVEDRTYDNAFFFSFLTDHYGGPELMRRIIANANLQTSPSQLITDQVNALGYNKTFADLTKEFATAIVTGNFTDVDGSHAVLHAGAPIAAESVWNGSAFDVSSFTRATNGFNPGDPLQVQIPFGMEFVKIKPTSNVSVPIDVSTDNRSCFEATLVTHDSNGFAIRSFAPSLVMSVPSPARYDEMYVVVTRGQCASSGFSVLLGTEGTRNADALSQGFQSISSYSVPIISSMVAVIAALVIFLFQRQPKIRKRRDG